MKQSSLYWVTLIGIILLTVVLLIEEEETYYIITSPKVHAFASEGDTSFYVSVLSNYPEGYFFDKEFVFHSKIVTFDESHVISVELDEITTRTTTYWYDHVEYQIIDIKLSVSSSNQDVLHIKEAFLKLTYQNDTIIKCPIGEFLIVNYTPHTDLAIGHLSATTAIYHQSETVSGIYIELVNTSEEEIIVKNADILLEEVYVNDFYVQEIGFVPNRESSISDILLIENYNVTQNDQPYEKTFTIVPKQTLHLFVPLSYSTKFLPLTRFPIEVNYFIGQEEKQYIIDDFPYINTLDFHPGLEDGYVVYELPH